MNIMKRNIMKWFIFIGWFAPIILVAVYAVVREYSSYNTHCWMDESSSMFILKVPVLISLLASIVFLVNVVRVLCNKLHPGTAQLASSALISLQGVCVSCLFCFVNHDVLYKIRGSFVRMFQRLWKPVHITKHDGPPGSQTRDIIV